MTNNHSVSTIDEPEFIDVHPYNPLISECQIKVLYIGKNRNGSYIDKDAAIRMANSLPMSPIVGYYSDQEGDFLGHGNSVTIEDGHVRFESKTRPYGFVAPDARVWFQKFIDTDENGQEVEREYMMTTGYLWTGQYEEAKKVLEEGKGQSMELDGDSVDGRWAEDSNSKIDFFIINDALFSKLCILGDGVEPCFEGASITAKETEFSYDEDYSFRKTLRAMMYELNDALGEREGGSYMPNEQEETATAAEKVEVVEEAVEETVPVDEPVAEQDEPEQDESAEEPVEAPVEEPVEDEQALKQEPAVEPDFQKKEDDSPSDNDEQDDDEDEPADDDDEDDEKKPETKHSLVDEEVLAELAELREFKHRVESREKDAVINKYHMLSDADKADVVAHKDEYSLQQIDEKLALVYVNKNVDFSTVDGIPETEVVAEKKPLLAFSLDDVDIDNAEPVDAIQEALRNMNN